MPPGTKNYPSGESVMITDTFNRHDYDQVNQSKLFGFNEELPSSARGLFIGGESGQTYTVWMMESDGSIVPHYQLVPGVIHPIFPRQVVDVEGKRTTATKLIIKY